jgi:hypothetical protein
VTKVIVIRDKQSCLNPFHYGLNMRQLLNPIFFGVDRRHPDMKRQRSRRARSRQLAQARALKARFRESVPRELVAPPEPAEYFDMCYGVWPSIHWRCAL